MDYEHCLLLAAVELACTSSAGASAPLVSASLVYFMYCCRTAAAVIQRVVAIYYVEKYAKKNAQIINTRNKVGSENTAQPLQNRSPVLGANYLKFDWFVPKNGTAVLKGLTWASIVDRSSSDRRLSKTHKAADPHVITDITNPTILQQCCGWKTAVKNEYTDDRFSVVSPHARNKQKNSIPVRSIFKNHVLRFFFIAC